MPRFFVIALNIILLGLASGLVSKPQLKQVAREKTKLEDFFEYQYYLGDFSDLLVSSLLGQNLQYEGQSAAWSCNLEFGIPPTHYKHWIHGVDMYCEKDGTALIFPLGEGEFSRAYTKGRLLIKGDAAQFLLRVLEKNSDDESVESPVSERLVAWGPSRTMEIYTLRRFNREANLKLSVECYKDAASGNLHSCALSL
ncbi:MAG: hypothetical protein R3A80_07245 [Bdellovibrionota bacterium]